MYQNGESRLVLGSGGFLSGRPSRPRSRVVLRVWTESRDGLSLSCLIKQVGTTTEADDPECPLTGVGVHGTTSLREDSNRRHGKAVDVTPPT